MRPDIPPPTTERTSVMLARILDELTGEDVPIDYVVRQLRRRSFGGLFILLAMLGLLPGISFFAGFAMLVPAIQMSLGFRAPVFPRFIRERRIRVGALKALGNRMIPWLKKVEYYVRPRWFVLTQPPIVTVIGILTIGLAIVVMLPLPFSNLPAGVALASLSIGLLERDGVIISLGLVLAAAALFAGGLVAFFAAEVLSHFLESLGR